MRLRPATPLDAPGLGSVHVRTWRSTYPGLVPAEVLAGLDEVRSGAAWAERLAAGGLTCWVLEAKGGGVVGFAFGGPARPGLPEGIRGELYALYLLQAHQGLGWGRALVAAFQDDLAAQGLCPVALWVILGNPAQAFYEALGATPVACKLAPIGGHPVRELAYRLPDPASPADRPGGKGR